MKHLFTKTNIVQNMSTISSLYGKRESSIIIDSVSFITTLSFATKLAFSKSKNASKPQWGGIVNKFTNSCVNFPKNVNWLVQYNKHQNYGNIMVIHVD